MVHRVASALKYRCSSCWTCKTSLKYDTVLMTV